MGKTITSQERNRIIDFIPNGNPSPCFCHYIVVTDSLVLYLSSTFNYHCDYLVHTQFSRIIFLSEG